MWFECGRKQNFDVIWFYFGKLMFFEKHYDLAIRSFENVYKDRACVNWYWAKSLVEKYSEEQHNCKIRMAIQKKFKQAINIEPKVVLYYLDYALWCEDRGTKYWDEAARVFVAAITIDQSGIAESKFNEFICHTEAYENLYGYNDYFSSSSSELYFGCGYSVHTGYE